MSANKRLQSVMAHLEPAASSLSFMTCAAVDPKKVSRMVQLSCTQRSLQAKTGVVYGPIPCDRFPTHRHEALKWNGWGFNEARFYLNEDRSCGWNDRLGLILIVHFQPSSLKAIAIPFTTRASHR